MAGELLKTMASISMLHIPCMRSAGARTDVLGGQVDLMFDALPTMSEHIKGGKVKALATTGRQRPATLAEVPTVAEAGVPGYEATIWLGLMAPRGTPPAVVAKLRAEPVLAARFIDLLTGPASLALRVAGGFEV